MIKASSVRRTGARFSCSVHPLSDRQTHRTPGPLAPGVQLFSEKSAPAGIFIVVSGEVKLSINSSEGKRLILSIAKAGEVLGLSSVLSGLPSEMTAEVLHPLRIAVIELDQFLAFMSRHPEVYQVVTLELSLQYEVACEQLRTVALSGSALRSWHVCCWSGVRTGRTESGMRFRFSLTHEEIGEFIGASHETVTRTLSSFKSRRLVAFHGSILEIRAEECSSISQECKYIYSV